MYPYEHGQLRLSLRFFRYGDVEVEALVLLLRGLRQWPRQRLLNQEFLLDLQGVGHLWCVRPDPVESVSLFLTTQVFLDFCVKVAFNIRIARRPDLKLTHTW
jgi:hypothetical protein